VSRSILALLAVTIFNVVCLASDDVSIEWEAHRCAGDGRSSICNAERRKGMGHETSSVPFSLLYTVQSPNLLFKGAVIPRQLFEVAIQAVVGSKVISRESLSAMRKDVTAGLYGGKLLPCPVCNLHSKLDLRIRRTL
jgi:hypothetical protein